MQRLDVGTSGVMVICKSEHAYSKLKNAFRHREVDKTYHALVQGHPDPHEGTIDAPIGRHPKSDWKFAVMADGRPSVTHYSTLEAHRFASLLEVHLETGRTHQIRVHMAALKHPCVGRPPLRRRPHARRPGRARPAVAARRAARLRASRDGGATSSTSRPTPTTWPPRSRSSVVPPDLPGRRDPASGGARGRRRGRRRPAGLPGRGRDAAGPPPRARGPRVADRAAPPRRDLGRRGGRCRGGVRPVHRRPGSTTCTSHPTAPDRGSAPRCSTSSRRSGPTASACGSSR